MAGPHQAQHAEAQHQQAASQAHGALLQAGPHAGAHQAQCDEHGQGAQPEGQHDGRAIDGRAAQQRRQQHAVDHATRDPAPQSAQRQRLELAVHGQQQLEQRLYAAPQQLARAFQVGQAAPHVHQVQAQRHQHQVGQPVEGQLQRGQPGQAGRALGQAAGQGAGHHVAADAARVVGGHAQQALAGGGQRGGRGDGDHGTRPGSGRGGGRQGADDAAAHADAVHAAGQADGEHGQEVRPVHDGTQMVREKRSGWPGCGWARAMRRWRSNTMQMLRISRRPLGVTLSQCGSSETRPSCSSGASASSSVAK